jgi:hypothetical protein
MAAGGAPPASTTESYQRLALAVGGFSIAYALAILRVGHGAPDFYVFWTAARHAGAPYDPTIIVRLEQQLGLHGVWPFVYPPTLLLVVWPFAQLPMTLGYAMWTGIETSLLMLAASFVVRPVWATALLALSPVVFFSAELGQTSLLIGAVVLLAWRWRESRPWLAGALFGLAACIKPQAMIVAPLILWGRWRMLAAMAATGLAVVATSALAFGLDPWLQWPRTLAAFSAIAPGADRANPSALIASPWWAAAVAALGLYLALTSRDITGLIGGALCLTPYAHGYDLVPLAPIALAWLADHRRYGWGLAAAGGAMIAGLASTPLGVLAFLAAVAVFQRWPKPAKAMTPAPASTPAPTPAVVTA